MDTRMGKNEIKEEEEDEEEQKWTKGETEKQRKQENSPDVTVEIQEGEAKKRWPFMICWLHLK